MITPIFLSPPNAQHFNLNQDHHQGDLEHAFENFLFYSTSVSSHANLYLDQGLGSTTTYIMNDQSQAFNDQLEGSNTVLFNGESPSYGTQVNSNGTYRSQDYNIFDFKKYEADQESNNLINSSEGITTDYNELRWMSSKMRMMRKLKNSRCPQIVPKGRSKIITSSNDQDQAHQLGIKTSSSNNNNGVTRVCSDCNTTKTPLWRSGPQGPKSLCNACGIRQRKARKAAMEAATQTGRTEISSTKTTGKVLKITNDKKKSTATSNTWVSKHCNKKQTPCNQLSDSDHKTSSITNNSSKEQLSFKEFAVNLLRKNVAVHHRMFPQDEEEGALLLMALSYGLIQQT